MIGKHKLVKIVKWNENDKMFSKLLINKSLNKKLMGIGSHISLLNTYQSKKSYIF